MISCASSRILPTDISGLVNEGIWKTECRSLPAALSDKFSCFWQRLGMLPPSPIKNAWPRLLPADSCSKYPGQSGGAQTCTTEPETSATSNSRSSNCSLVATRTQSFLRVRNKFTGMSACLSPTPCRASRRPGGTWSLCSKSIKQILDVILDLNPLPCCHSSENGAASRSTLPVGID